MNQPKLSLIGLLCLAAIDASHGQTPPEANERFLCTSAGAQRLVSIFTRPAGQTQPGTEVCRVEYTKDGKTQTLWRSKMDRGYCAAQAIALVTKLSEGGYACKPQALGQAAEPETSE
jgi:hypothetical protein